MNSSALKDRIKAIAVEKGVTFNEVWKQILLERFLARLSNSDHHEKFIFKGGLAPRSIFGYRERNHRRGLFNEKAQR